MGFYELKGSLFSFKEEFIFQKIRLKSVLFVDKE